MPVVIEYNRKSAIQYAQKWALKRNPKYFDFSKLGGDCTNFISQAIHAGNCNMNYSKNVGWYYINANSKSPSWTATNFLYNFLINNNIQGPYAMKTDISEIEIGDIIQLNFENDYLYNHSLIVTGIAEPRNFNNILICSHTKDRLNEPLSSINFSEIRYLHILGSFM